MIDFVIDRLPSGDAVLTRFIANDVVAEKARRKRRETAQGVSSLLLKGVLVYYALGLAIALFGRSVLGLLG